MPRINGPDRLLNEMETPEITSLTELRERLNVLVRAHLWAQSSSLWSLALVRASSHLDDDLATYLERVGSGFGG